jgi:uncharacterized protein YbjT (DUF2867 family)
MAKPLTTALIAGASGLVGGECLRLLLASKRYERVIVLTRRDLGAAGRHRKVVQVMTDLSGLDNVTPDTWRCDHVFCALGTTIRKAGSQARFREVDFEYPRRIAQLTRAAGASCFALVSALGASRTSPFFYSRVKGDLEAALRAMHWPSLCIVRPSLIAGDRGESRPLERLAEAALRVAPQTWRPVHAREIARAMVQTAARAPAGVTIIESRDIPAIARSGVD